MTKRTSKVLWNHSLARVLKKMTKAATAIGSKTIKKALRDAPAAHKGRTSTSQSASRGKTTIGIALTSAGARRYQLYKPPRVGRTERLPVMVMLHGCGQDAKHLAASTRMNQLAAAKRFLVLYPEQDRLANSQACWNWFDTRSGRAQREADSIDAAIAQACLLYPVDQNCIVIAGLSAGASMAALMALRRPDQFCAVAMHSGVAPGIAHSSATALMAMRGTRTAGAALPSGILLPPLLVIQGSSDRIVTPDNGDQVARLWAAQCNAKPRAPRTIQRGARYPARIIDYEIEGKLMVTHCEVTGLRHAWSGGAAGHTYSDQKGPDASAMIWTFARKQFSQCALQVDNQVNSRS